MTDNKRVSTKDFYELQMKMMDKMVNREDFKEFRRDVKEGFARLEGVPELASDNKDEIDRLRGENTIMKVLGSVVTVVLGLLGIKGV